MMRGSTILVPLAVGAALAAPAMVLAGERYLTGLAVVALALATQTIAFNLLFGLSGQLFLCLGALAATGGYTATILVTDRGWSLVTALVAATALGTAAGAGLSWVCARRRLSAMFVGVVTLAASLMLAGVLLAARQLTGGETGRALDVSLSPTSGHLAFAGLVAAYLAVYRAVETSRFGWRCRAVRDDEVAAALAGIDVVSVRVAAATLGSAMLAASGALFVYTQGFVSPSTFEFAHVDVRVIVAAVLGGLGSLLGPVVGALVLSGVDELLRPLGGLRLAVYGAALVVGFLWLRDGLVRLPVIDRLARARRRSVSPGVRSR